MIEINKIGIIGSGTMGTGIAQVCVQSGYNTILFDSSKQALEKSENLFLKNIDKAHEKKNITEMEYNFCKKAVCFSDQFSSLKDCDLIIEAIVENLDIKQNLFSDLSKMVNPETILASNTSSLSITAISGKTQNPDRVIGIHFFNPAYIMKLVEIIRGVHTSNETVERSRKFIDSIKKTTVVAKDTPGFIVNRIARPFYGEAFKIIGDNISDVETADKIMEEIGGFKMGPFRLLDLIGIDVNFEVTKSVYNAFFQDPKYRPHIIQQRMVEAGRHGIKSKKGFYSYEN